MKTNTKLHTDGRGYWSRQAKTVKVTDITCDYADDPCLEVRVYFDTKTWDVKKDGLIYTDELFERELKAFLASKGIATPRALDLSYSEQGMQGDDYVSFDCSSRVAKLIAAL